MPAGLRCSECGHEAKKERHLHRSRRRWRLAVLGFVLVLGGLVGSIRREGWLKVTPTVVYIALLPHLDSKTTFAELGDRVGAGQLWQWEYRFLVRRSIALLRHGDPEELLDDVAQLLAMIEGGGRDSSSFRSWASWALVSQIDCEFYAVMGACRTDTAKAIPLLREGLQSASADVRLLSLFGLALFGDAAVAAMPHVLALQRDEDEFVRRAVIGMTALFRFDDIRQVIQDGLADTSPNVRLVSLRSVGKRGTDANQFLVAVEAAMTRPNPCFIDAALAFVQIGGHPEQAVEALLKALEEDGPWSPKDSPLDRLLVPPGSPFNGLIALGTGGVQSSKACAVLKPMLFEGDPRVRKTKPIGLDKRLVSVRIMLRSWGWLARQGLLSEGPRCRKSAMSWSVRTCIACAMG